MLKHLKLQLGYLVKLILIFAFVLAIITTYEFVNSINYAINYIETDITDITFENNELSVNAGEQIIVETSEDIIIAAIIDTSDEITQEEIEEYSKKIGLYDNGVILLKDKMILKTAASNIQNTMTYSNLSENMNISNFEKQDILDCFTASNYVKICIPFFLVIFLYLFIVYMISTLIDALILAFLGFLTSRIVRIKIKYSALYNMAIYALTLPVILNLIYIIVNSFTGFVIEYFTIMYTTVSYIIMITAILMIKSDLIKRQADLMKIISEQEKVKQELEEQKRREQEEQERKNADKKEEQKKKKESKKNMPKEGEAEAKGPA